MARLQIYDGQEKLEEVKLGRRKVTVGRDEDNVVVLEDASVSRRHAEIEPTGGSYLVRDNASTNGTFVNDLLIRIQLLSHGDVIRVGRYVLRVDARSRAGKESTRILVESLGLAGQRVTRSEESAAFPSDELWVGKRAATDVNRRLLERLRQLRAATRGPGGRDELGARSVEYFLRELEADRSALLVLDSAGEEGSRRASPPEPEQLRCVAAVARKAGPPSEIRAGQSVLKAVLRGSEALVFDVSENGFRGPAMVAPLIDDYEVLGVILVDRVLSGEPFDEDQRLFFSIAAQQIALSLSDAGLVEELLAERSKVQGVFGCLTDGILVTDAEFRVMDANGAAAVALGGKRRPVGQRLFDVFENFHIAPGWQLLVDEASKGGAVFGLTRKGTAITSRSQSLAGHITPYPRGCGAAQGFVVVLRDSTETRRTEHLKRGFISNVAHKLRTPLTVIQGNLPMIREDLESPQLREELLDEIERNSSLLCQLVDVFIDFAEMEMRAESDAQSPVRSSLRRLVSAAIKNKQADCRAKGIEIQNRVPEDLPRIPARVDLLRDAIERVIDNSLKFSDESAEVVIDAEASAGFLKLHVTDGGPGIPPEEIGAVFYIGHQVDRHGTGQIPGAGLGLTIARHIVQQHGGDIRITSPCGSEDHGTRVSMFFPLATEGLPTGSTASMETGLERATEVQDAGR